MFAGGDRVKLKKEAGGYGPGAKGVVMEIPDEGVLQVDIDTDESGNPVQPPFPLPPLSVDYFEPA